MRMSKAEESEEILNALKDDLLVTDKNGQILRVSEETKALYGIEEREIVGASVYDLERQGVFTPIVTPLVLKKKDRVNIIQTTNKGRKLLITGVPVFDEEGEVYRIASYSHDITEMVNMKHFLAEMQDEMERVKNEIEVLRNQQMKNTGFVGNSYEMKKCLSVAKQVAEVDVNVLILGESGVGKTHLAKLIHRESGRCNKPFIEVNCGAIPESLFESEFFGYEAGSFTSANKKGKLGLAELAEGGTLFLDEIGELSLPLQVKVLRFIQEKQFYRVGGTKPRTVDFRLIAATNQPLEQLVQEKKFREDLYFRLNVVPIRIPPLRERTTDILPLLDHFVEQFSKKYNRSRLLDDAVKQQLFKQPWPGNIRELINLIERLVVVSTSEIITMNDLPESYYLPYGQALELEEKTLPEILEGVEREVLQKAKTQYRTTVEMAKYLGVSQPTIVRKLSKYKIK
ncbi:PAS modulated sigma54 specific transcriptional regulator, Fis family protein [Alkalihalophilus pseudofirmus OF4]|uniref:HTH-type transcriptional regulatory protein TyrR n=1 Tax=Alkalihalophilus pseudofirmus (strain ATCC BAA-2126 / JCM 17055 / OF4) TaxID=398511 RepID=D3FTM3_ALKPO|nr:MULTISPECIES: sigma 54-interacting transcriptional regulator [Alkalihalophilus]ADC50096.1 PAS modulated sigma54 specific transcriptional regulator, Fis family protein [Alkalihalophilus pseudofirmus OF4]MED1599846.1 sigma 54-interacting transcriptional regulator [Alkalihalophilus marmarensis]